MKIGFLVNDCLPGMGLPCSGQGLRAWGLIQGLRANGIEARAFIRHSTLGARMRRWHSINSFRVPEWVTVINNKTCETAFDDLDALVFHNWAAFNGLKKPKNSAIKFVYDFFSSTLIEHSFISSDAEYLSDIRTRKQQALDACDVFIANGAGRQEYGAAYLAEQGKKVTVGNIPMCLPWLGNDGPAAAILVGGYKQNWTNDVKADALSMIANSLPDTSVVTVGAGHHYHFGANSDNKHLATQEPENLIPYDVLPFSDYLAINRRSSAFVDVAQLNEERRISFSSRGVLSISAGCPVIHNAETELGQMIELHNAGETISAKQNPGDPHILLSKIKSCLSQDRRDQCYGLWEKHFDAQKGAATLVRQIANA